MWWISIIAYWNYYPRSVSAFLRQKIYVYPSNKWFWEYPVGKKISLESPMEKGSDKTPWQVTSYSVWLVSKDIPRSKKHFWTVYFLNNNNKLSKKGGLQFNLLKENVLHIYFIHSLIFQDVSIFFLLLI